VPPCFPVFPRREHKFQFALQFSSRILHQLFPPGMVWLILYWWFFRQC
jgi:hypothetical protein